MMSRRRLTARLHDFIQPLFFSSKKLSLVFFIDRSGGNCTLSCSTMVRKLLWFKKKKRKEMKQSEIKHKK